MLRVGAAMLAALGLLSVAVFGAEEPLWAQEADSTGVGISLGDLSDYPTHLTVDRFLVELSNLTTAESYQVTVSSDSANVGIGGCGTRTRTATVTGVAERELVYLVYACTVGEATVTAEVRRTGADSLEASVSQRLTVEAIPENAIGARGERVRAPAAGAVPKAGTPGSVPDTYFSHRYLTSARANWGLPSDGGRKLTGYGLLFWRKAVTQPPYDQALVREPEPRNYTYRDLEPETTYRWRIHACNDTGSCGIWTEPVVEVTTGGPPERPHSISVPEIHVEARSAQVRWSPHLDTGGPDMVLTGFGVLWRVQGTDWQYGDAVDVDRNKRNYTMTGLLPSTPYEVIVQSCNGTDSCSPWNNPNDPVAFTTDEPERIVDRPPGPVLNLTATGRNQQLVVDWDAPTTRGSSALTNYTLQYKRQSTTAWTSFPAITAPNAQAEIPTQATIGSLTNGTTYDVQVQACNANTSDRCGAWLQGSGTPTAAVTAPSKVDRPSVSSGLNRLTVTWDAPADGGSPITRYDVQHVEKPTPPPDPPPAPSWPADNVAQAVSGGTSTSIGSLTNGTTYLVRVRACNAKGCGDYSDPDEGTPRALAPTRLARPSNLNVEPLPGRKARLTWNAVTSATGYVVQVQARGSNSWGAPDRRNSSSGVVRSSTQYEINLDAVITTSGSTELGLADARAYEFHVKATASGYRDSFYSSDIIIIDTPITVANGYSTDGDEVQVTWTGIHDTSILGSDYSNGTYEFRYRKSTDDPNTTKPEHSLVGWRPHMFDDPTIPTPADKYKNITGTSKTIDGLSKYQVYAIQVIKRSTGSSSNETVFAARDAYVWATDRAAGAGERVAGFPLTQRLIGKTYRYTICEETFFPHDPLNPDKSRRNKWIAMIDHAAESWATASRGLISVVNSHEACAPYHVIVHRIGERIDMERKNNPAVSDMDLSGHILDAVHTLHAQGIIRSLHSADPLRNEILMWDNLDGPLGVAHRVGAFRQIADDIAYEAGCWWEPDGTYFPAHMCSVNGDIIVRRDVYDGRDTSIYPSADDPLETPRLNAKFNKCMNDSDLMLNSAYSSMLHEIGHALGIGGGKKEDANREEWESAVHPPNTVRGSVMNYYFAEPDCSPHPLDIMAIYALYQKP